MSDESAVEITQQKVEYVAKKWSIPEHEAERMLKNHRARQNRDE